MLSLKALRAFRYIELHSLTFLQAPKALLRIAEKCTETSSPVLTADKAEALGIVKPFHCSLFDCRFLIVS